MQFNDYQDISNGTSGFKDVQSIERIVVATLGLSGESGEMADHIKKVIGHGHQLNVYYITKELGDILWYVAEVASALGLTLNTIAEKNVEKLAERYPNGFDSQISQDRYEHKIR